MDGLIPCDLQLGDQGDREQNTNMQVLPTTYFQMNSAMAWQDPSRPCCPYGSIL